MADVAALYVAKDGCYFGVPGVDPWDETRDARSYPGPHRVVAHPPCERWGKYWNGGPAWIGEPKIKGDDDGCFAAALASVRQWGGVLEHPAHSSAWATFGLVTPPKSGGWVLADEYGWTCHVEQGAYGHRARKATWLYAVGVDLPDLKWGSAPGDFQGITDNMTPAERTRKIKTGACQNMGRTERRATPPPFRDLLIGIARG